VDLVQQLGKAGFAGAERVADGGHRLACSFCLRVGYAAGPISTHPIKLAE